MSDKLLPIVSVVIPARNEEGYIYECIKSIVNGSYPRDRLEILIVDGESEDRTKEIAERCQVEFDGIRVLNNSNRIVPHAMNIGIRAAQGTVIVRADAHARYGSDYLRDLVTWMNRLAADNVGGVWITVPGANTNEGKAVALVLSHPFGVGSARYRLETAGPPQEVDTVPFGCYRREIFDRIGFFDELFVRNQDDEFNARLKMSGGKIFLIPSIRIEYVARETLSKMARMLFQYGYFKPLIAIKLGRPATWRQLGPPALIGALLVSALASLLVPRVIWVTGVILGSHAVMNLTVSVGLIRRTGWRVIPYAFCGFLVAHVAYGSGYLRGLFDFGVLGRHRNGGVRDVTASR